MWHCYGVGFTVHTKYHTLDKCIDTIINTISTLHFACKKFTHIFNTVHTFSYIRHCSSINTGNWQKTCTQLQTLAKKTEHSHGIIS